MKEIICELRIWSQMKNDPRSYDHNLYNCVKKPEKKKMKKKIQDFNGAWTRDLAIPVRRSTNWAMKPLTLGAGQFWVHMFPWKICKWMMHMKEIICELRNMKSNEEWSSQLWSQFVQLRKEAWKKFRTSTGLEPVTSRYRCDALPTELWSHWRWEQVNFGFICSRERYVNEWCIWKKSYVNCEIWNQMKNDPRSYDRNLYNCVKKPEKNSGLQRGLNPWPRDTGATLYQLSYEATDVGSRSILGSYVPVKDM